MSTRAMIAVKDPTNKDEIIGVYHHFDGYPTGLGRTLWSLAVGPYKDRLDDLVKILIYDNVDGWSSIGHWTGDPSKVIGHNQAEKRKSGLSWEERLKVNNEYAVYYDGERANPNARKMNWSDVDVWIEWVYVFDLENKALEVYENVHLEKCEINGTLDLTSDNIPDFEHLESMRYEEEEL